MTEWKLVQRDGLPPRDVAVWVSYANSNSQPQLLYYQWRQGRNTDWWCSDPDEPGEPSYRVHPMDHWQEVVFPSPP